jgi:hypothetical protein
MADSAYLGTLGPVQWAGSVARVFAVDLVAVHADDHLSTPGKRAAVGREERMRLAYARGLGLSPLDQQISPANEVVTKPTGWP